MTTALTHSPPTPVSSRNVIFLANPSVFLRIYLEISDEYILIHFQDQVLSVTALIELTLLL